MSYLLLIFFLVLPNLSLGNENLASLKVNNDRSPYILQNIISHLKKYSLSSIEKNLEILNLLKKLNDVQKGIGQEDLTYLTFLETNKTLLNYKMDSGFQYNRVSENDIEKLKTKLKEYELIYTDYSMYILNQAIADFSPYIQDKNLNSLQNSNATNSTVQQKIMVLKNLIEYSGKWINKGLSLSPLEFNALVSNTLTLIISHLIDQVEVFKMYSTPDSSSLNSELFPQIELVLSSYTSSIKNKSKDQSNSAPKKVLKSIKLDVPSNPQEEINKLLKGIKPLPPKN